MCITYTEHCYVGDQIVPPRNVDNCDGENKEVIPGSPLPTLLAYSQEKTFYQEKGSRGQGPNLWRSGEVWVSKLTNHLQLALIFPRTHLPSSLPLKAKLFPVLL